ncbi:PAS domain-containing protein [Flavobacterium sp. UBA6135]|uniref:PAS domain-containing protein n=1 Tax=Flavobacterium sp. UBA6135 TaxID=1946553 RepID=UPI0025BB9D2F|nr:PAS domain-containing protein [Flavobacterium sp. UBA6135]
MTAEFEKAIAKYHGKLNLLPLPLVSWNVFSSNDLEISVFNSLQNQWKDKVTFESILLSKPKREIVITDAKFKIVFATHGIQQMNGYHPNEVMGKSPNMFQGELTSETSKNNIRKALAKNLPFKEVILNYRKDGTVYHCEIEAYPKFDSSGKLVHYIAFERLAS